MVISTCTILCIGVILLEVSLGSIVMYEVLCEMDKLLWGQTVLGNFDNQKAQLL